MSAYSSFTKPQTLAAWLTHLEAIHPSEIELGLTRVKNVFDRLKLDFSDCRTILVAGTNGKGTTCHLLQSILTAKGYKVGCYNSPHLTHYRERVTLSEAWFSEDAHCQAFALVENARLADEEISLTYFEMGTLAALVLLAQAQPDFIVIEVGLGGRLDATNILPADISVVTTIALDHQDWLGDTREAIGFEKAGIFKANKPAICGDINPPDSIAKVAKTVNARLIQSQKDFIWQENKQHWSFQNQAYQWSDLVKPLMPIQNAAAVLATLTVLDISLDREELNRVFSQFSLAGRWQQVSSQPDVILDVGHNPQATAYIKKQLNLYLTQKPDAKVYAVVGLLKDKAIKQTLAELTNSFEHWFIGTIDGFRGTEAVLLAKQLPVDETYTCCENITTALQLALQQAKQTDLVLAFGSFYVVADVIAALDTQFN